MLIHAQRDPRNQEVNEINIRVLGHRQKCLKQKKTEWLPGGTHSSDWKSASDRLRQERKSERKGAKSGSEIGGFLEPEATLARNFARKSPDSMREVHSLRSDAKQLGPDGTAQEAVCLVKNWPEESRRPERAGWNPGRCGHRAARVDMSDKFETNVHDFWADRPCTHAATCVAESA